MTSKKLLLAGLIAAFGLAGSAQAAVVNIKPKLVGVFNADFSPVDPAAIVSQDVSGVVLNPGSGKYLAQIDVVMTISDLQAGQGGFGNAAFNINLGGGLRQSADVPGWGADTSTVDSNGSLPQGVVPKWADNGDFGSSGTDLQGIIIGTAPKQFSTATGANTDPRKSLGVAPFNNTAANPHDDGEYAGSVFVEFDGVAGTAALFDLLADGGSVYDDAGNLTTDGTTGAGGSVSFSVVPEPSALALLGLGSALLVFARKRR